MIDLARRPPVSPSTLDALVRVLADDGSDTRAVADVVSADPGLLARVLGLANSALYGPVRSVDDATLAVGLVGRQTVRTLAVGGVTGLLATRYGLPGSAEHATLVGAAARELAPDADVMPSVAFTAGLLHDIGELLLWQEDPMAAQRCRAERDPAFRAASEQAVFGTDHVRIGAAHLRAWGFPDDLVVAVAQHHEPGPGASRTALVVAAADEIAVRRPGTACARLGIDLVAAVSLRERAVETQGHILAALAG